MSSRAGSRAVGVLALLGLAACTFGDATGSDSITSTTSTAAVATTSTGPASTTTAADDPVDQRIATTTDRPVPARPPSDGQARLPRPAAPDLTAPDPAAPDPTNGTPPPPDDVLTAWVAPAAPPRPAEDVTPILVTVFSHNERTPTRFDRFRSDPSAYASWRSAMIDVVELMNRYGVRYSWQTDYVILEAIDRYEADAVAANPDATDGLPIVTWMADEMGVSIEAHAHECITPPDEGDCHDEPYNYADVVAVIEQITGYEPAPVIGGTSAGERSLDEFGACIHGNVVDADWCPSILIGFAGATGGHTTDDHHSGVWRPAGFDDDDFLTHDPSGPLLNIGRGESLGLFTGGRIGDDPLEFIQDLASVLESGEAPSDRVYTATLNFNEDMLVDDEPLEELRTFLDELTPLQADGRIVYANFPEVAAAWDTWYGGEPNIYPEVG